MTEVTHPDQVHDDTTDRPDVTVDAPGERAEETRVDVRRSVALSGAVGAVAAVLTVAFAVRAFGDGAALDWVAFAALGLITVLHAAAVADGRAPLMVVDRHGVRLREGSRWQGIAWDDVECFEHLPRRLPFRDGHLLVAGHDEQQLVVPLTLATRVVGADRETLSDTIAELADGRADVVEVVPGLPDAEEADETVEPVERVEPVEPDPLPAATTPEPVADEWDDDVVPEPGRATTVPARVEVQGTGFLRGLLRREPGEAGPAADTPAPPLDEAPEPVLPTPVGDATTTIVLDDCAVNPAAEPVVGPQLEAARQHLRLSIDQLSERTRIRPHVIEAIEVDDFAPCGGDFYARGHLRTLARVLGVDAAPLLALYDERYADAPLDPRRVFEAELATGVGGSIRGTRGGRNWSVLVAAVMAAVLVWSVARLVMDGPVTAAEPPVLNQSGGISQRHTKVEPVPVTLTAAGGGAKLVVRDASGDIVFDGELAFGQTSRLEVAPPVRIWSSDGSVTVSVAGADAAALGDTGEEVTKLIPAP